jgi:hypothetical protein
MAVSGGWWWLVVSVMLDVQWGSDSAKVNS